MIFHNIYTPALPQCKTLDNTAWGDEGFSSTETENTATVNPQIHHTNHTSNGKNLLQPVNMPYNIYLSNNPFDDIITISIKDFGNDNTMGMILHQCHIQYRPKLIGMHTSQLCQIKNWRSTIKNGEVVQIEEHLITTVDNVIQAVQACCQTPLEHIQIQITLDTRE